MSAPESSSTTVQKETEPAVASESPVLEAQVAASTVPKEESLSEEQKPEGEVSVDEQTALPTSPTQPHHKPKFAGFKRFKQLAKFKGHKEAQVAHPLSHCEAPADAPVVPASEEPLAAESIPDATTSGSDDDDDDDPCILAQTIRQLIDSLPMPTDDPSPDTPAPPAPHPPARDSSGCPIPPPSAIQVKDKHLISLLSNAKIMNGKKEEWPTVWSFLLASVPPAHQGKDSGDEPSHGDGDSAGHGDTDEPVVIDNKTIMFYVPLSPTDEDKVEVAEMKLVPVVPIASTSGSGAVHIQTAWKWWPFHGKKGQTSAPPSSAPPTAPTTPTPDTPAPAPAPAPGTPTSSPPAKAMKKVWLPSTTKISVEVTWWGYRMFLPPPIMTVLSNKEIEAVKRATMITTALTWLFSHLPLTVVPAPMQPVLLLLQTIVPYVSYIGTFISWSWSTIKGYDVGYGVVLNATWLLPVALLPSTWDADDYPDATPIKETNPQGGNTTTPTPTTPSTPMPSTPALPGTSAPAKQPFHTTDTAGDLIVNAEAGPAAAALPSEVELVDLKDEAKEVSMSCPSPSIATKFVEHIDGHEVVSAGQTPPRAKTGAGITGNSVNDTASPDSAAGTSAEAEAVPVAEEETAAEVETVAEAPEKEIVAEKEPEPEVEVKANEEEEVGTGTGTGITTGLWKYFTG